MTSAVEELVWRRANACCEYCRLPQAFSSTSFEIDDIIAQQHGRKTTATNLAVACFVCNHYKGPNLASIDPRTDKLARLFNPRRQRWQQHFRWKGAVLQGRTATGRATIRALAINLSHRVQQRAELMREGVFPPV